MATHHTTGAGASSGISSNAYIVNDTPRASARSAAQRSAGSTTEVDLSRTQVRAAWTALSHQYVVVCLNEIVKRLISGRGIIVQAGDQPKIPTRDFATFLDRDMTPFAREALNCILTIGVVPIAFRRPRTAGLGAEELAPYVPMPGTYTITTWAEAGMQRFSFYWNTDDNNSFGVKDPRVVIAHDFGYDPNINGTLRSNMHVIANELRFAAEMSRLALVAERIASNPPVLLAYNFDVEVAARAAGGTDPRFFAGDLDACANREDFIYTRDSAQARRTYAAQLRSWEAQTGQSASTEFGEGGAGAMNNWQDAYAEADVPEGARDFSGAEMPWARTHRLGVTDQHINHQLPRARTDYTELMKQVMDTVCGVLSVPRGVLAASSTVRAGVEATTDDMHKTITYYADMLSKLMTSVYRHIFGEADLREELRSRAERRRKSPHDLAPSLMTAEDLFDARRAPRVQLSFDLPPPTSSEALTDMRNQGIISWQTYGELMLRTNGMRADQLDATKDPLSATDRKDIVMGLSKPQSEQQPKKRQRTAV